MPAAHPGVILSASSVQLTREVRFQLPSQPFAPDERICNSWSGWPKTDTIAPFVTVRVTLAGPVAASGFIANVKAIDRVVRDVCVASLIQSSGRSGFEIAIQQFQMLADVTPEGSRLIRLELCVTPYQSFTVHTEEPTMAILTQQFEFSAAHRLHCDELSDDENRQLFGKCNNPNGHGHNYVLDVSVARDGDAFNMADFEKVVCEQVIDPFDHKHLDIDVPEFQKLNSTVENIATVIWRKLESQLPALTCVRVYETPKTWAEVNGS